MKLRLPLLLASLLIAAVTAPSFAAINTWTGNSDSNWEQAVNWQDPTIPGASSNYDEVIFPDLPATQANIKVGDWYRLNALNTNLTGDKSLSFSGTGSETGFIFGGTGAAITATGKHTLTLGANVTMAADLSIQTDTASIAFGSECAFDTGSYNLTVIANKGTFVSINNDFGTDSSKIIKKGAGTLILAGGNNSTGGIDVLEGTLTLGHESALGSGTLTLGDSTHEDVMVNLESTGGDKVISNQINWENSALYIHGSDKITFAGTMNVIMDEDRTIDVNPGGYLTLGTGVKFSGSGGFRKSGRGEMHIQGTENYVSSFSILSGRVYVGEENNGSQAGHFTLGSRDNGYNPLGTGKVLLTGVTSQLVLNPGEGGFVNIAGEVGLDFGASMEVVGGVATYIKSGSLLDGGTSSSGTGVNSRFILGGDVYFEGGGFVNSPTIEIMGGGTLYGEGLGAEGGTIGLLQLGEDKGAGQEITLDSSAKNIGADVLYLLDGTSLKFNADNQIMNSSVLRLGTSVDKKGINLYSLGYSFTTGGLEWSDSNTTFSLKGDVETGGGRTIHFGGDSSKFKGGSGLLIFKDWTTGKDSVSFDYDVQKESWLSQVRIWGYNYEYGYTTVEQNGKYVLVPKSGANNQHIYEWTGKAYLGGDSSKSGAYYGNWDHNDSIPDGAGIEVSFKDILGRLSITLCGSGGEGDNSVTYGGISIASKCTLSGADIILDNKSKDPFINTGSNSYESAINNNITFGDNTLKILSSSGFATINGKLSGTGDIVLTGGTFTLTNAENDLKGDYILNSGTLEISSRSGASTIGDGTIIFNGGSINSKTGKFLDNGPATLTNQVILNSETIYIENLILSASGNAEKDVILLNGQKTFSINSFTINSGRDLQGTGGIIVYRDGTMTVKSENSNYSGGLTIKNGTYIVEANSDIVMGKKVENSNYAGTGNITFNGGKTQNTELKLQGAYKKEINFDGGVQLRADAGIGKTSITGSASSIKFSNVKIIANSNAENILSFAGGQNVQIGEVGLEGKNTWQFNIRQGSLTDSIIKSIDAEAKTLSGIETLYTSGYTQEKSYSTIIDSSIKKIEANVFHVYDGGLELRGNDQIGGVATLKLGDKSFLTASGTSNTFGDLIVGGSSSLQLGTGGKLTFTGNLDWQKDKNTNEYFQFGLSNATGVWNTADDAAKSSEAVYIKDTSSWTPELLDMLTFTGYTKGGALVARDSGVYELVPTGEEAMEWTGGGFNDTSWTTGNNWFNGNVPNGVGHVAIFRDVDEHLDTKIIQLNGNKLLYGISFESTKSQSFTISNNVLEFSAKGEKPARITGNGSSKPIIDSNIIFDNKGLFVDLNLTNGGLTINGSISDKDAANPGVFVYNGKKGNSLYLMGINDIKGGLRHEGGDLILKNASTLDYGYTVEYKGDIPNNEAILYFAADSNNENKIISGALYIKATSQQGNGIWTVKHYPTPVSGNIIFNGLDASHIQEIKLYYDEQRMGFENERVCFGEYSRIMDANPESPTMLSIVPSKYFTSYGQNTFSGGFSLEEGSSAYIGSSSVLNDPSNPDSGIKSGPLGTGVIHIAKNASNGSNIFFGVAKKGDYTLHNQIIFDGNSTLLIEINKKDNSYSSITLDSKDPVILQGDNTNSIKIQSGGWTNLLVRSQIDLTTQGGELGNLGISFSNYNNAQRGFVRLFNSENKFNNLTLIEGYLSIAANNVMGSGDIKIAASGFKDSYVEVYGELTDSRRDINQNVGYNLGGGEIHFIPKLQEGKQQENAVQAGQMELHFGGGKTTTLNSSTNISIVTALVSGESESSPDAQFSTLKIVFDEDHDITNATTSADLTISGTSGAKYFSEETAGFGKSELEFVGSKSFGTSLTIYDTAYVTTTLKDKDMAINARPDGMVTPFGSGQLILRGGEILIRTGDQKKNVYSYQEKPLGYQGILEITGGGDLIFGNKADGGYQNGTLGNGRLDFTIRTSEGSSIRIDGGGNTITANTVLEGNLKLNSGTLALDANIPANASSCFSGVDNILFNGGTLNLQQISLQTPSTTMSLGESGNSALDFGGIGTKAITYTLQDLGDWNEEGTLRILNWNGVATGNGTYQIILTDYTGPQYIQNIRFRGFGPGAKVVSISGGKELVPYSEGFKWRGAKNDDWTEAGSNWGDNDVPNYVSDAVIFDDDSKITSVKLPTSAIIGSLTFESITGEKDFTISGSTDNSLLIFDQLDETGYDGMIVLDENNKASIQANMELREDLLLDVAKDGALTLGGKIYHDTGFNKHVQKNGDGAVTISGDNTYAGGFSLNKGTVNIAVDETLSETSVKSGAFGTSTLTINGGTISAVDKDRTVSNKVVINDDFAVSSDKELTLDYHSSGSNKSQLTKDTTITVDKSAALTITKENPFEGKVVLTKEGEGRLTWNSVLDSTVNLNEGTLELTNANTYTGETVISGGVLAISHNQSMGTASSVDVQGDATLRLDKDLDNIAQDISITEGKSLTINLADKDNTATSSVINGTISGDSALLNLQGGGTLTLSKANTYSGGTSVDKSSLILTNQDAAGSGKITLNNESSLMLNFNDGVLDNAIQGEAKNQVVVNGKNITLSADNSSFKGAWEVSSTGSAQISGTGSDVWNNLGSSSSVNLKGKLSLSTTSGGDASWANTLTGDGDLEVTLAKKTDTFTFDAKTGTAYAGVVDMRCGIYDINAKSGDLNMLSKGTLRLSSEGSAVLDSDNTIGGLHMDGGTLKVLMESNEPKGLLTVTNLDITSGKVAVSSSSGSSSGGSSNLFADSMANTSHQIIKATGSVSQNGTLTLTDYDGNPIDGDTIVTLYQPSDTPVAEAYYNNKLTVDSTSDNKGVYLGSGLTRINNYTEDLLYKLSNDGTYNTMAARLTSTVAGADADTGETVAGGFEFAAKDTMIINNSGNNYAGETLVSSGTVQYGADNAFGKSSGLTLSDGTTVDMNGKAQIGANALGSLNMSSDNALLKINGGKLEITDVAQIGGESSRIELGNPSAELTFGGATSITGTNGQAKINLDGGKVTFKDAASITGDNALVGAGKLLFTGTSGTSSSISGSNTNLSAQVSIAPENSVSANSFDTLGSGDIILGGTLQFSDNAAKAGFNNAIDFTTGTNPVLSFNNASGAITSKFTGDAGKINLEGTSSIDLSNENTLKESLFNVGKDATLTAHEAKNMGNTSSVELAGSLVLDQTTAAWDFNTALSGAGSLLKKGTGTATISQGNAEFTGDTSISSGILELADLSGVGSSDISIQSQGTLNLGNSGDFSNHMENTGIVNVNADGVTLSGKLSGDGQMNISKKDIVLGNQADAFTGSWKIMDGATARMTQESNLGAGSSVQLQGQLSLTPTMGDYSWNNALTGQGSLNVTLDKADSRFKFTGTTGSAFTGTLDMIKGTYDLNSQSGTDNVLKQATLQLEKDATTILDQNQTIEGFTIKGGTLKVATTNGHPSAMLTVTDLDTSAGGTVAMDIGGVIEPGSGVDLFADSTGSSDTLIVKATGNVKQGTQLTLTDYAGNPLSGDVIITLNQPAGTAVAEAWYNYKLTVDSSSPDKGIYLGSGLTRINNYSEDVQYKLTNIGTANTMYARLTSTVAGADADTGETVAGGFEFAAKDTMIINNSGNNYAGETLVSSGTVQYGADNAFGKSSGLTLSDGTTVDMNGKTQIGANALGSLNMSSDNALLKINGGKLEITDVAQIGGESSRIELGNPSAELTFGGATSITGTNGQAKINLDGSKVTFKDAASITGDNALVGAGNLLFTGASGTSSSISGSNTNLSAQVSIAPENSVSANSFDTLGSGNIILGGTLQLSDNAAKAGFNNAIDFTTGTNPVLSFNNASGAITGKFTGDAGKINLEGTSSIDLSNENTLKESLFNVGKDATLTAHESKNMGESATIIADGTMIFDQVNDTWAADYSLTGKGHLIKQGKGTLTINRVNADFDGDVMVRENTLNLSNLNGVGAADITIENAGVLSLSEAGEFQNTMQNHGVVNLNSSNLALTGKLEGEGQVNVRNTSITLSGDSSDFTGNWNIEKNAEASFVEVSNLGLSSQVNLNGQLNISRDSTAGGFTWVNHLEGNGLLTVSLAEPDNQFNFDTQIAPEIGLNYHGTLKLGNSTFLLGGDNTAALSSATLESHSGNKTIITDGSGKNEIGGLIINGGYLDFSSAHIPGEEDSIVSDYISLVSSQGLLNIKGGTVAVDASLTDGISTDTHTYANLLVQDDGNTGVTLIETRDGNATGGTANLVIVDSSTGEALDMSGAERAIDITTDGEKVADGYYNFGTSLGERNNGLHISYKLNKVDIYEGQTLTLDNENAVNAAADFSAYITGAGNLLVNATGTDNKVISLSYSGGHGGTVNDFTGTTTITSGTTLKANADNVISCSNSLIMNPDSSFDMNGTSQTVNTLTGTGNIAFNGEGTLTLNNGEHHSEFSGKIQGDGQIIKTGEGNITLTGVITAAKGTLVNNGQYNLTGATTQSGDSPAITLTDTASSRIDGGVISSKGTTLFATDASNGSLSVANMETLGTSKQRLLDARGEGEMSFTLDNIKDARGDIYAAKESLVNMTLKNGTTFTGKIDPVSLTLEKGTKWNVTANSQVTNLTHNGTINFQTATDNTYKKLEVLGNMINNSANGAADINMNVCLAKMDSDQIHVSGNVSGSYQINIKRNQTTDKTSKKAFSLLLVDVDGTNNGTAKGETNVASASFTGGADIGMKKALVQAGDIEGQNKEDWYLVYKNTDSGGSGGGGGDKPNTPAHELSNTARGILGAAETSIAWFAQHSNLKQRMGELRMNRPVGDGFAENAWVRTYGSQYNVGSKVIGSRYDDNVYGADLGMDKGWNISRCNQLYTGVFGGYGYEEKSFNIPGAKTESDNYTLGAYATLINSCGTYIDFVVKAQHFDNDITTYDDSGNKTSAKYGQWAYGASLEVGHNIDLQDGWYITPSMQISYMHGEGIDYSTRDANVFDVNATSTDLLRGSLAVDFGRTYALSNGGFLQPYFKLEAIQQVSNGGRVHADDDSWRPNVDGAQIRAGLGLVWQIDNSNQVHISYDYSYGEKYNMPWNFNLGYRYQF